jgi:hypothetical protein
VDFVLDSNELTWAVSLRGEKQINVNPSSDYTDTILQKFQTQ